MFIATKTGRVYLPGGGAINFVKDEEVKPGVVKKAESVSPGATKRFVIEVSDNYIQRQLRWLKIAEKDLGIPLLWTLINAIFLTHIPENKKVGQWCVGKQNKISQAVVKQFPDVIKCIKNEYKSTPHNWDGSHHQIIVDDNKIEDIVDFINYQCLLLM